MAELTKLTGTYIRSGSIPTTALSGGVVSSSLQVVSALPGNTVSSSAQVTALLPTAVVSSSGQVTAFLPTDTVSSSAQVKSFLPNGTVSASSQYPGWVTASSQIDYGQLQNIPSGIASSSAQVKAYLPVDSVSSSVQVTAFLPVGTVSSSTQLPSGIASSSAQVKAYLPTDTVSSSAQVTAFLPVGSVSSSVQVDFNTISNKPTLVSASSQVDVRDTTGIATIATTGSNTFTAPQTISDTTNSTTYLDGALHVVGGMSVRKDVRVSGSMTVNGLLTAVSMSTQYVTSSQYNIGVSKITLNDDDLVRFAGLSIVDSGSSSPATASIYWDSMKHKFLYENLSGSSYNSALFIAGPKNTGSLGDEIGLTSGYLPYATGDDHISDSVMFQTSSRIGIGTTTPTLGTLQVNGNVHATSYTGSLTGSSVAASTLTGTLQTAAQTNVTSVGTLSSLGVSGLITADGGIYFNTNAAGGAGRMYYNANNGVTITANTGTNKDFTLLGPSNSDIMYVPTGTTNVVFTGSVGIGTTPSYRLDVNANSANTEVAQFTGTIAGRGLKLSTYATPGPYTDAGVDFNAQHSAGSQMRFSIAGTPQLMLDTNGNFGIGTTSPSTYANFVISKASPSMVLVETTSGTNHRMKTSVSGSGLVVHHIDWDSGLATRGFSWIQGPSSEQLMRIDASGNLGLGVTPSAWDASITAIENRGLTLASQNAGAGVWIASNAYVSSGGPFKYIANGYAQIYEISANNGQHRWYITSNNTSGANAALSPTQAMTLDVSGSLLVNTTSNAAGHRLVVNQTNSGGLAAIHLPSDESTIQGPAANTQIRMGSNLVLNGSNIITFGTSGSTHVRITSTGNVGIGTTAPADNLDVFETGGGAAWRARILSRNDTGNRASFLGVYEGIAGVFAHSSALDAWADLYINGVNMNAGNSANVIIPGNVGIGTTSASNKLTIRDTSNTNTIVVRSTNASLSTDGVVGIIVDRNTSNNSYYPFYYYNETAGVYRFRIADSGAVATAGSIELGSTTGSPPTSGIGIKFPATQNASSDANTLDDYEEGDWTPAFSEAGTPSYTTQFGKYTKVGRIVYCTVAIRATSVTGTGLINVTGLPFSAADASDTAQRSTWRLANGGHLSGLSDATGRFRIAGNTMSGVKGDNSTTYMTAAEMTSTGTIQVTGDFWYYV